MPEIVTRVVWTLGNFENNLGIDHNFSKYLKESCVLDLVQYFSFKYFQIQTFPMVEKCYQLKVDEM